MYYLRKVYLPILKRSTKLGTGPFQKILRRFTPLLDWPPITRGSYPTLQNGLDLSMHSLSQHRQCTRYELDPKKRDLPKYNWTKDCQEGFDNLKRALTSAPILAYPDYSKPFILETDASLKGLGAVLSQHSDDNTVRVIAYASRSLRPGEKSMKDYSSAKIELLALKWSVCEKFKDYLLGSKFTVYTDNNPLVYVKSSKLGAAQIRWLSKLAFIRL